MFQVESVFSCVLPLLAQQSTLFGGGVSVGGGVMLTAVIVAADLIGASSVVLVAFCGNWLVCVM